MKPDLSGKRMGILTGWIVFQGERKCKEEMGSNLKSNVIMIGPPGSEKTMLAKKLPTILT
jgi:ATP-dependent protease Clp ATPase subunit